MSWAINLHSSGFAIMCEGGVVLEAQVHGQLSCGILGVWPWKGIVCLQCFQQVVKTSICDFSVTEMQLKGRVLWGDPNKPPSNQHGGLVTNARKRST